MFLDALGARAVLVVLSPPAEVCRQRNAARDSADRFDFDGHEALAASMRSGFGDAGWWLDTSGLGPEQTASLVVAEAAVRGRRGL